MKRRIAFFKRSAQSRVSTRVEALLREQFPEHELDVFDTRSLTLRAGRGLQMGNLLAIARLYPNRFAQGRKEIQDCWYHTPFMAAEMKRVCEAALEMRRGEYDFTFQTGSLYDCSCPGIPHFVYTQHTHKANLYFPHFDPANLFHSSWIKLEKGFYENAARVFTMSHHVERSLHEHYGIAPEKTSCVYSGFESVLPARASTHPDYANGTILFNAPDWCVHGGKVLEEAFLHLLDSHPEARLLVLGSAPSTNLPNTEVLGRLPVDERAEYFGRASIFCVPTLCESFGFNYLEAFDACLPVISSDVGALPDIVHDGESGFLVPPGDADALAGALRRLLDSPSLCRGMAGKGRDHVHKRYTWQATGERIRKGVVEVLEENAATVATER